MQDLTTLKTYRRHVKMLKKFKAVDGVDPVDIAGMDQNEALVEAVVDADVPTNRTAAWKFRVRWTGYGPEDDTWEDWETVKSLKALNPYLESHPELHKISPKLKPG